MGHLSGDRGSMYYYGEVKMSRLALGTTKSQEPTSPAIPFTKEEEINLLQIPEFDNYNIQ